MATNSMPMVICPWICLNTQGSTLPTNSATTKEQSPVTKPSYAEIAKDRLERTVDLNQLPIPTLRGNTPVIRIPGKSVDKGLDYFKFSLVTRIDAKGRNMDCIKAGISDLWSEMGAKVSSLGRGYLLAKFDVEVDYKKVKFGGPWYYGKQLLRVSDWTPNFNVGNQRHSNAEIWVKFPGLSLEYWELDILMAMARTVGSPIHVDRNTLRRDNGYYANVLVDIDLSKRVPDKILVEVEDKGLEFWQEIQLGALPNFCNNCKVVGHETASCRFLSVANKDVAEGQKDVGKISKVSIPSKRKQKRDRQKKTLDVTQVVDFGSEEEEEYNNVTIDDVSEEVIEVFQATLVVPELVEENLELPNQNGDVEEYQNDEVEKQTENSIMEKNNDGMEEQAKDAMLIVDSNQGDKNLGVEQVQDVAINEVSYDSTVQGKAISEEGVREYELNPHHGVPTHPTFDVQEDPPGDDPIVDLDLSLDPIVDLDLSLDPINMVDSTDNEILVPDSQVQLVKEAELVLKLLEGKSTKDKQGNMRSKSLSENEDIGRRKLVAKISKKKIALLPAGPFKERLKAMSLSLNEDSCIDGGGSQ